MKTITLSPVSSKAQPDYDREKESGLSLAWDDSKHNTSNVGESFGFFHHGTQTIEIHEIVAILPPSKRDVEWTKEGHSNRNVLVLSNSFITVGAEDFFSRNGVSTNYTPQGTQRIRLKK